MSLWFLLCQTALYMNSCVFSSATFDKILNNRTLHCSPYKLGLHFSIYSEHRLATNSRCVLCCFLLCLSLPCNWFYEFSNQLFDIRESNNIACHILCKFSNHRFFHKTSNNLTKICFFDHLYCSFFHIIQFRSFLPFYLLSLVVIFHSFLRVSLLYIRLCVFDSSPLSDIPWSSRTPGDILRIPSVALKTYCRNGTLLKIINIKISFWECFCINKKKILNNRLCSTLKSLFSFWSI